ncbi:Xaa-Pro aminopeptidase [Thiorhodospira sibirica]|uniref:Xaa-Pro aminopeptidase n=1 Tax=Thiorhodospira sibirica TaxID=154347 RepID=UPI00022C0522|nr:Xaa-Pro aminopeptidase [Thiorhodospira sibirica]
MTKPSKPQLKALRQRRRQLMRQMGRGSIAILAAQKVCTRNRDVEHPYRQSSDFLYLTGFAEPEAVAVLIPGRPQGEYILFCRARDAEKETWHGRRAGQRGAVEDYGADDSFPIDDLDEILPGLMEERQRVYACLGLDTGFDQRLMGWVNQLREKIRIGVHPPHEFVSLEYLLHEMRLMKSDLEIELMRQAAQITTQAHIRAMQVCQPGMLEYAIEAELLHEFRRHGAHPAYPSIVGGGANGCILHYHENDAELRDGDLLLIDAGCEVAGYASDITRTFPVNGRFSSVQRDLYECVLSAQEAAIAQVKPGNHWDDPHTAAVRALTKGLIELGLLKGRLNNLIKRGAYRSYYMHRTGHWLGLDVHDVGDYKIEDQWRVFEPGMVLTVEPGIYIPASHKDAPKPFHNIGIRIEDDVRVTASGHEVLTAGCPKTVSEIEALIYSR